MTRSACKLAKKRRLRAREKLKEVSVVGESPRKLPQGCSDKTTIHDSFECLEKSIITRDKTQDFWLDVPHSFGIRRYLIGKESKPVFRSFDYDHEGKLINFNPDSQVFKEFASGKNDTRSRIRRYLQFASSFSEVDTVAIANEDESRIVDYRRIQLTDAKAIWTPHPR